MKMRTYIVVAAAKHWELHQMVVHNAFLDGELGEKVNMHFPPGYAATGHNKVCQLRKSLYGLRQAPRCWFAKLAAALTRYGFVPSSSDYSLFTYQQDAAHLSILFMLMT